MESSNKQQPPLPNAPLLKSESLDQYILETAVYPREAEPLKELRNATASHPRAFFGTSPVVGQLMAILMKLAEAKKTIEVGVFTGYSLLLTALNIPNDGQIIAIDPDRKAFQIGFPIMQKAGVAHKINFIEAQAIPVLDKLLEDKENEGSFDFAYVDADKNNYVNYHERLMKLVKIGGIIVYDNTLWGGTVALPENEVPESKRMLRNFTIDFNRAVVADKRAEISLAPVGDGIIISRRLC